MNAVTASSSVATGSATIVGPVPAVAAPGNSEANNTTNDTRRTDRWLRTRVEGGGDLAVPAVFHPSGR